MWKRMWHRVRSLGQRNAAILMYHQVCEKKSDPWDLAVHPERFAAQLYALKKNFSLTSMEELADAVEKKKVMKKTICLTFDDAFADNYTHAAPMLEYLGLPASFFVSTESVGNKKLYWWEELQCIILHTERLPSRLTLNLNGEPMAFEFRTDHALRGKLTQEIKTWRSSMPASNERIQLYVQLWQRLKPLRFDQQEHALRQIRDWSQVKRLEGVSSTMQISEVRQLSTKPLFTIGAHTVHHAMLGSQTLADQAFEISESKRLIEKWIDKPVIGFAYPYGNYSADTKSILRDAGFRYAVSTECRGVKNTDHHFELPRIQVKNWTTTEFTAVIRKALS